jgi:hypothetical protein
MRKLASILLALIILVASATTVFADSALLTASNGSNGFKKQWSATKKSSNQRHYLTYGYDTTLINEDYAYANSIGYIHRSKIINGNGTHYGPKKAANSGYSDIEVRHKGTSIKYYCMKTS